jgi:exonuclease III
MAFAIGCLYLPNGNPQPGPDFDYKLAWCEGLIAYAAALLQPKTRGCFERLIAQGWTDALRRVYGDERICTFWDSRYRDSTGLVRPIVSARILWISPGRNISTICPNHASYKTYGGDDT